MEPHEGGTLPDHPSVTAMETNQPHEDDDDTLPDHTLPDHSPSVTAEWVVIEGVKLEERNGEDVIKL